MNYLVDTNVLSEPRQKHPEPKVVNWLKANESSLYTSVLVTAEIRYGIELLPPNSSRRADLLRWYERMLSIMGGRVLSVNTRVAEEWARLQAEVHAKHLAPGNSLSRQGETRPSRGAAKVEDRSRWEVPGELQGSLQHS